MIFVKTMEIIALWELINKEDNLSLTQRFTPASQIHTAGRIRVSACSY